MTDYQASPNRRHLTREAPPEGRGHYSWDTPLLLYAHHPACTCQRIIPRAMAPSRVTAHHHTARAGHRPHYSYAIYAMLRLPSALPAALSASAAGLDVPSPPRHRQLGAPHEPSAIPAASAPTTHFVIPPHSPCMHVIYISIYRYPSSPESHSSAAGAVDAALYRLCSAVAMSGATARYSSVQYRIVQHSTVQYSTG